MKITNLKLQSSKVLAVLVMISSLPFTVHAELHTEANSGEITPEQIQTEALAIEQAYAWSNYQQRLEEIACYQKFFVNACLDAVYERFRQEQSVLRKRQINNNQAQRNYEAQQRITRKQQALSEQAAQQADEDKRRQENKAAYQQKLEDAQRRIQEKNSPAIQQERNQKRSKYQQKQQEAEQHRRDIELKKQNEKQRAEPAESLMPMQHNRNQGE
jgi:hypothetical protein